MSYSLQPRYRKYVQRYGFLSFARNFKDKHGKKLINSAKTFSKSKYGRALKKKALNLQKLQGNRS